MVRDLFAIFEIAGVVFEIIIFFKIWKFPGDGIGLIGMDQPGKYLAWLVTT